MKEMIYNAERTIEVLVSGTYNGYEYAIVSYGTHPCAYIKLPEGHKYYGLGYDKIPVECHGGLTYSSNTFHVIPENIGWWIGWDYNHGGDYYDAFFPLKSYGKKWTTTEILEEVKDVVHQLIELNEAIFLENVTKE